ncbi:hypothetical protein D3C81_1267780 [compost metagenome]
MTNIVNAVFQHGNPFNPHTKGKAAIFFRIIAAHFENARMYHAASQNFKPACLFADTAAVAVAFHTSNINLYAWFSEREKAWTKTDLCVGSKHFAREFQQSAFKIAHANSFAYNKALDLMELE